MAHHPFDPPVATSRRAFITVAAASAPQLFVLSCASPTRLAAVPSSLTAKAQPAIANVRFFPDRADPALYNEALASYHREVAWLASSGHPGPLPPVAFLTMSGGGSNGAFGAGLLTGWTEAGTRPEFKLVTGISTGSLIAPFAFMGPKYDPILAETYTRVTDDDIFKKRNFTAALFSDAMADTSPLAKLVSKYVTRDLLDAIAGEYAKGRLLLIGTTDLDSREPVYWNIGAMASSKDPAALTLARQVIRASASIPGAFPPVMIDVTVNGVHYQEMHVDGGATRQVFMYPPTLRLAEESTALGIERKRTVYIIRNARLDPDWASVDRRVMSISGRAISSLIQTQGFGDLNRMYLTATRDHVDFNLAYIPSDFNVPKKGEFDAVYMTQLFARGREMAVGGYPWSKYPPGYDPNDSLKAQ